jgi:hypothetical protein
MSRRKAFSIFIGFTTETIDENTGELIGRIFCGLTSVVGPEGFEPPTNQL